MAPPRGAEPASPLTLFAQAGTLAAIQAMKDLVAACPCIGS